MDKINEMLKERFYIEIANKYHISDATQVYRKEVDEDLIHDFYALWSQCNELIQEKAEKEIEKDKDITND